MTDARFSGVSTGACIGHAGPEALAGGPIGKLVEGDGSRSKSTGRLSRERSISSAGKEIPSVRTKEPEFLTPGKAIRT